MKGATGLILISLMDLTFQHGPKDTDPFMSFPVYSSRQYSHGVGLAALSSLMHTVINCDAQDAINYA